MGMSGSAHHRPGSEPQTPLRPDNLGQSRRPRPPVEEPCVAVARRSSRAPPPPWPCWLSSGSVEGRSAARCDASQLPGPWRSTAAVVATAASWRLHHVPQERTSEHTVEQIAGVPVPRVQERILEVAEITPQKRIPERIVGQIDDVPVPQIHEQNMEVANTIPQERISERIVEYTRDVPVPQIREQIVEVVKNIPQEHISERTAEQTVDVTTPQILEEIVEAVSAPHERVQQRTVEHVGTVKTVPLERISERISEQIVVASVPHVTISALLSAVAVKRQKNRKKKKSHDRDFSGDHAEDDPDLRALMRSPRRSYQ